MHTQEALFGCAARGITTLCQLLINVWKNRAEVRWRMVFVPVLLVAVLAACGGFDEPASLDGRWDGGADSGEVIIDGSDGTYSDTFGADPGEISLTQISDTEFTGEWNEGGTIRFGTLDLVLESNNRVTGEWTADPNSDISGSSGGLLVWER